MKPKLRVWVVFGKQLKGKQLKFGDGRARLLELIDERGSLRQAAAELRMSYRNAWGYLRELEKAAGFKFVERAPGGNPRSGMRLTRAWERVSSALRQVPARSGTGRSAPLRALLRGQSRQRAGAAVRLARLSSTIRSGVSGSWVIRTPMASWTALAIAAGAGMIGGSPTPRAPKGPAGAGTSTMIVSMLGRSAAVSFR